MLILSLNTQEKSFDHHKLYQVTEVPIPCEKTKRRKRTIYLMNIIPDTPTSRYEIQFTQQQHTQLNPTRWGLGRVEYNRPYH